MTIHLKSHTIIGLLGSVCLIILLSGCSHLITKTEIATPTVPSPTSQTQPEVTPKTSWEEAYGEPQDGTINEVQNTPSEPENVTPKPATDLWQRIRHGYAINESLNHPEITQQLEWFVRHPDYIARVVERARPYLHYIVDELEQRHMPLEIALLPVVESGFQPFAYSHGRAAGLWQFIPGTARLYGLKQNWWYDGRRDVMASTKAALDYIEKLYRDFGDWQLALAAYNCGEGTVSRAIKRNIKAGKPTHFWSLDLPRETSTYVPKLLAIAELVNHPEQYHITLKPIDNSPFLTVVDIGTQIDLALAAKLAGISTEEIYQYNPGFNRWATQPDGPHRLVLPIDKAAEFQQALADLPPEKRVQWTRHKIKQGESLGHIARHYKTTIAVIKKANGLHSNQIRAGHFLLIPVASAAPENYPLSLTQRLATQQRQPHSGKKHIYTVKPGDTWWDIAHAWQVSVRRLAKWNGKAPGDLLHPGQKLVIWSQAVSTSKSKTLRTINYTVKSGDSLWTIARKFNVTVNDVKEWNSITSRTLLKPGQNLTIHVDVTQQYGRL